MEGKSITDDVNALTYDSVLTIAKSLKHVSSHFDLNISDFDPLKTSELSNREIGDSIRDSVRNTSFRGCSVRPSTKMIFYLHNCLILNSTGSC